MRSRRLKPRRSGNELVSADKAFQGSVNAIPQGNGGNHGSGPISSEKETRAPGTRSAVERTAEVTSPCSQVKAARSDNTTAVLTANSAAPIGEKRPPTSAAQSPLTHISPAYFFNATSRNPPTRSFASTSRYPSPIPFLSSSPPAAPPPSPISAPNRPQDAVSFEQRSHQPLSLPSMYPGNHNHGQFPHNNDTSHWMAPTMAASGTPPGIIQNTQQGKIPASASIVLPPGYYPAPIKSSKARHLSTTPGPRFVPPFTAIHSRVGDSSSTPSPTPTALSISAICTPTAVHMKKNEYKGPLIVSSPVRPQGQQLAQQRAQQSVQQHQQPHQPTQQSVYRAFQQPAQRRVQQPTQQTILHRPQQPIQPLAYPGRQQMQLGRLPVGVITNRPNIPMNNSPYNNTSGIGRGPPAPIQSQNAPPIFNSYPRTNNASDTLDYLVRSNALQEPFQYGPGPKPAPAGAVLKISNIPYNLLSREVVHFLGRRAKLLPENRGSSVHIVMERSTAKTMDCYVELLTQNDAQEALAWVNRNLPAHSPRLGDRHVHVETSSQDELLREMFPRAKCVLWTNGYPEVQPNTDRYSTGFQGFLTNEEMFCMVHHAEAPKRAPFAEKCPQRPYEFMISTLDKFPWFAKSLYTVEHRNVLFDAVRRQLLALAPQVNARRVVQLDARLLRDLLNAGLRCPAFNERQRILLRSAAGQEQGAISITARFWPFDTLTRKENTREHSVEEYARLIRTAVLRRVPNTGELNNSWDIQHGNSPFGPLMLEWQGEGARRSMQAAINAETGVMRGLVSEGLAALNTVA